jgi:hypothetical protein
LLDAAETRLDDDVLDCIDRIAPPGTDIGVVDVGHRPPAIENADLRRRPADDRSAAWGVRKVWETNLEGYLFPAAPESPARQRQASGVPSRRVRDFVMRLLRLVPLGAVIT